MIFCMTPRTLGVTVLVALVILPVLSWLWSVTLGKRRRERKGANGWHVLTEAELEARHRQDYGAQGPSALTGRKSGQDA